MSADNEISYTEFKDSSGEIVATFSNGTWHAMGTPVEDARTSEFYGICREAWNGERRNNKRTIAFYQKLGCQITEFTKDSRYIMQRI